jgi:2-oxoisovalerate dehydrogenase E1 component beta subunit
MGAIDMAGAVRHGLREALQSDERVVLLGRGIGRMGGVFRTTEGLLDEFGDQRIVDMPLDEAGVVGAAIGMALYGDRPVAEIEMADFVYPAFDQIVSEMAKLRYRSGGQYACPTVLRMPYGGGVGGGHYHSQSPEAYFAHTPGLIVVAPSSPADAVGLLRTAVRGDDPVIFLEPKALYESEGELPDADGFTVPFGVASRVREGADVTVVAFGGMVPAATLAADAAAARGIGVDLIDLRTLVPFDIGMLLESVAKTGRAVLVQEAPRTCGYTAELAAVLAEKAVFHLQAPVIRVAGLDTPYPYALERAYIPDDGRVLDAIERVAEY